VAVLANALVLFLFASQELERFLLSHGLPAFPLVPVSSSQAIVGSVIGIGLIKGGRGIRWRVLGEIAGAWVVTPIAAIFLSFIALFFLQNVFLQKTFLPVEYRVTKEAEKRIQAAGIPLTGLEDIRGKTYPSAYQFKKVLDQQLTLTNRQRGLIISTAEIDQLVVAIQVANRINDPAITDEQKRTVQKLWGMHFTHRWQLDDALAERSQEWRMIPNDKEQNKELRQKLDYIYRLIRSTGQ
jgi:inorganic phosphate transporter, PiT family